MITAAVTFAAVVVAGAPTPFDIQRLEALRVSHQSSIRVAGHDVGVFTPTVETRGVICAETRQAGQYACHFEARVKEFFARDFGEWRPREDLVHRNADGLWQSEAQVGP